MVKYVALLVDEGFIDWSMPPAVDHLNQVARDIAALTHHFAREGLTLERIGNYADVRARLARGDVACVCVTRSGERFHRMMQEVQHPSIHFHAIEDLLMVLGSEPAELAATAP